MPNRNSSLTGSFKSKFDVQKGSDRRNRWNGGDGAGPAAAPSASRVPNRRASFKEDGVADAPAQSHSGNNTGTGTPRTSRRRSSARRLSITEETLALARTSKAFATSAVNIITNAEKKQQQAEEAKRHRDLVSSLNIRSIDRVSDCKSARRASRGELDLLRDAILGVRRNSQRASELSEMASTKGGSFFAMLRSFSPFRLSSLDLTNRKLFRVTSHDAAMMHETSILRARAARTCCFNTFERTFAYKYVWLLRHQSAAALAWDTVVTIMLLYIGSMSPLYGAFKAPGETGVLYTASTERDVEKLLTLICIIDVALQVRAFEKGVGWWSRVTRLC